MERVGTKTPTELIVGYCRKGWGHIREKRGKTSSTFEEASNIFVFKTDENQKKKQIKMHCCTWALCATVHKEKVYVLRLKQQQQQHQKLYDHKGITVLQKLLV